MWECETIRPFDSESLQLLLDNRIPAIRMADFATSAELQRLKRALIENDRRSSSVKQVTRFGISQYEEGVKRGRETYFRLAAAAIEEQRQVFAHSFDPVRRFIDQLRTAVPDVGIMREPEFGDYYAGNGKLRTGYSPIHVDFAPQDSGGWEVGKADVQLAWNLYIDVPKTGGELLLWEKSWRPEDDRYQVSGNYYFDEAVVRECRRLEIKPRVGEILLINSRNFHAIAESDHRFAFGSFISCFADGSMRLWS